MKMKSFLSILLALCLMASFVFCLPVQALAAEEESAGTTTGGNTATEGDTTTEGDVTTEGEGTADAPAGSWADSLIWTDGLPEPVAIFVAAFDNLFKAVIWFAVSVKNVILFFIPTV